MSDQPSVCCILLTADRPAMARRAVECFREQTYEKRVLLVLDSGNNKIGIEGWAANEYYVMGERGPVLPTIGELRNMALGLQIFNQPEIIVHWDDDDYSRPNRIAEQVELLQSSGTDIVGYNQMLFWREGSFTRNGSDVKEWEDSTGARPGEAWLYSGGPTQLLGTSLCYWRRTWEARPFEATSQGEDFRFCVGRKTMGATGMPTGRTPSGKSNMLCDPRMIARIHSGNTSNSYGPEQMSKKEWRRVPEWDQYVRGVMECR